MLIKKLFSHVKFKIKILDKNIYFTKLPLKKNKFVKNKL